VNVRSLRFRLAVWYFCTVTAIFALAAFGYWFTIRWGLNTALDEGLGNRLLGLRQYLENTEAGEDLVARLEGSSPFGLFEVFDEQGQLVGQSYGLSRRNMLLQPPPDVGSEIRFENSGPRDFPLRVAWQKVEIAGRSFVIGAADPQAKYREVLTGFLYVAGPIILVLATLCGLWLGRRALGPVARITDEARAITETNLSTRLAVPQSRDELQQLSETLNEMLGRIEQSFMRTKQFTADASHELRAPLTLIYTAAQYALRRPRSREELVESLSRILRESRRTITLIEDLLALARGDAGHQPAELEVLDAAGLVRDAAEQATAMGEAKDVRVTMAVEPGELLVRGNDATLRRLLLILVDNAVKFTPTGGIVTLGAQREGADVALSVADTGVGIAADDVPHIFERFWRADKVRSREVGGTGLGLPIAQQIAEQHDATLDVHSEPGRGSVFTLRMPAAFVSDKATVA
jgi:signal transduction histidine kinase